jgi:hypothetical protein
VGIGLGRFWTWQRDLAKRQTERAQDRALAEGLEEGCVFCGKGPWAWAYPMRRAERDADGGDFLLPAWVPVCGGCHDDLEKGRSDALAARLQVAYRGRRNRQMREFLPVFLAARTGAPVQRRDAPSLVRNEQSSRR